MACCYHNETLSSQKNRDLVNQKTIILYFNKITCQLLVIRYVMYRNCLEMQISTQTSSQCAAAELSARVWNAVNHHGWHLPQGAPHGASAMPCISTTRCTYQEVHPPHGAPIIRCSYHTVHLIVNNIRAAVLHPICIAYFLKGIFDQSKKSM